MTDAIIGKKLFSMYTLSLKGGGSYSGHQGVIEMVIFGQKAENFFVTGHFQAEN